MKKKLFAVAGLIFLMTILTGCTEFNKPITSESEGFWNEYIVYPLSQLIIKTAEFAGGNFGISIIIVTILVRLVILPLMIKQTKSSKAMQAIQPQMKELQQKYSSKDQKTQQKLQEETMKLFRDNKVNPMAGCFPLLVQMPILIGFYHAISRTREIASHDFLWFSLGEADPYYILPIVAAITTFIQTRMTMVGTQANPQMQMMQWIMPIMILVFAINFPAALSLYWVVGNIFTVIQTYFIKGPEIKEAAQTSKAGGAKK
ncbi:MAG TPA: YidC family membrane integrase SpoIIIJ [Niallia sp.]|nr:YidC family membrane integrase SpoIIIJ [Niallia sp.]